MRPACPWNACAPARRGLWGRCCPAPGHTWPGPARASRHLGLPLETKDGDTSWHYKSGKIKISARKNVRFGDGKARAGHLVPLAGGGRVEAARGGTGLGWAACGGHPSCSGRPRPRPQASARGGAARPVPRAPPSGLASFVLPFGLTVKRGDRSRHGFCHVSKAERRLPGGGPAVTARPGHRPSLGARRACPAPLPAGQAFWLVAGTVPPGRRAAGRCWWPGPRLPLWCAMDGAFLWTLQENSKFFFHLQS